MASSRDRASPDLPSPISDTSSYNVPSNGNVNNGEQQADDKVSRGPREAISILIESPSRSSPSQVYIPKAKRGDPGTPVDSNAAHSPSLPLTGPEINHIPLRAYSPSESTFEPPPPTSHVPFRASKTRRHRTSCDTPAAPWEPSNRSSRQGLKDFQVSSGSDLKPNTPAAPPTEEQESSTRRSERADSFPPPEASISRQYLQLPTKAESATESTRLSPLSATFTVESKSKHSSWSKPNLQAIQNPPPPSPSAPSPSAQTFYEYFKTSNGEVNWADMAAPSILPGLKPTISNPAHFDMGPAMLPSVPSDVESQAPQPAAQEIPWNHAHPCYPHANVHVPLTSPLYKSTRLIRIPRDYLTHGDLIPTIQDMYPEILSPWISEVEFRDLIHAVNHAFLTAYAPATWRAIIDGVIGLFTGWLTEDFGLTGPKRETRILEAIIDTWNADRDEDAARRGLPAEERAMVKAISLRRTAFMSLDFQIPDPKVQFITPQTEHGMSRADTDSVVPAAQPQDAAQLYNNDYDTSRIQDEAHRASSALDTSPRANIDRFDLQDDQYLTAEQLQYHQYPQSEDGEQIPQRIATQHPPRLSSTRQFSFETGGSQERPGQGSRSGSYEKNDGLFA